MTVPGILKLASEKINREYDKIHPNFFYSNALEIKSHHHIKRCTCKEVHQSIQDYNDRKWFGLSQGLDILVSSTCFGSDSLGNFLGMYFEVLSCAMLSGLHYLSVAKVWEPQTNHSSSVFIDSIPLIRLNSNPKDSRTIQMNLKTNCGCHQSCHESDKSAWIHNLNDIKSIFLTAIRAHLANKKPEMNATIITDADISPLSIGEITAFIPDVAIHYRCSDNFVGHYGFLPFSAFLHLIPQTGVYTIYVLTEKRGRKTASAEKRHLLRKCDAILQELYKFLTFHFQRAIIVLKRGDDLYDDLARLTFAKITICSVSTFCLWPAISNPNKAYFPESKLVVKGNTSLNLNFEWIRSPAVVLGVDYYGHGTIGPLLQKLGVPGAPNSRYNNGSRPRWSRSRYGSATVSSGSIPARGKSKNGITRIDFPNT